MKKISFLWVAFALGFAVVSVSLVPTTVHAGTFALSKSPYWRVGAINEKLSKLCRRGFFNQVKSKTYNIMFVGPEGRAITGIAKKGWNLYDPKGLAEDNVTFHFFNDGYSNCRVYVAHNRPGDDDR